MNEANPNELIGEINKIKNEVFEDIIDASIKCIIETDKGQTLISKAEEIAGKCNLEPKSVQFLIKQLVQILSDGAGQNLSTSQLRSELEKLGLKEEKILLFFKRWEESRFDVAKILLSQTISNNRLVDMEWKFGVTAASSECNKIGNTFLQLKLIIDKGDRLENVHMELTLPQFYTFMHEIERAKASMELFS